MKKGKVPEKPAGSKGVAQSIMFFPNLAEFFVFYNRQTLLHRHFSSMLQSNLLMCVASVAIKY
jgi:hypothetical protein